jgi:MDMPI-like protein
MANLVPSRIITTHLRYDIVAPRGPIQASLKPLDDRRLGPAVSWLLAGIPRMQPKLPRQFAGPLGLDLTGPARTRVTISSDGATITVTPHTDPAIEPRAVITSSTEDFLAWSTTRLPWPQLVSVEGDRDEAARFLDALNLV